VQWGESGKMKGKNSCLKYLAQGNSCNGESTVIQTSSEERAAVREIHTPKIPTRSRLEKSGGWLIQIMRTRYSTRRGGSSILHGKHWGTPRKFQRRGDKRLRRGKKFPFLRSGERRQKTRRSWSVKKNLGVQVCASSHGCKERSMEGKRVKTNLLRLFLLKVRERKEKLGGGGDN